MNNMANSNSSEKHQKLLAAFDDLEILFKSTQLALFDFKTSVLNEYRYCARALVDYGKATNESERLHALARADVAISAAYNDIVDYIVNAIQMSVNDLRARYWDVPVGTILRSHDFEKVVSGLKEANSVIAKSRGKRNDRLAEYVKLAGSDNFKLLTGFALQLVEIEFLCEKYRENTTAAVKCEELLSIIRHALTHHEKDQFPRFELYYQPKFHFNEGSSVPFITGAEALIRLCTSETIVLTPNLFLNAAHRADLSNELGNWVLFEAVNFAKELKDSSNHVVKNDSFDIAINISPSQMASIDFVKDFIEATRSHDVSEMISIELIEDWETTDGAYIDVASKVRKLEQTTKVSIDDFGTGSTRLGYIAEITGLFALKIDQSIIFGLSSHDPLPSNTLIKGIMAFAGAHNLKVVAEGVETDEQMASLRALSVNYFQGFHPKLSKPLSQIDFSKMLAQIKN